MEELKTKLIESLLSTITYDEMTEEQEKLVTEYETEKWKPKIDELKKKFDLFESIYHCLIIIVFFCIPKNEPFNLSASFLEDRLASILANSYPHSGHFA